MHPIKLITFFYLLITFGAFANNDCSILNSLDSSTINELVSEYQQRSKRYDDSAYLKDFFFGEELGKAIIYDPPITIRYLLPEELYKYVFFCNPFS